jgi:hypothetical protein
LAKREKKKKFDGKEPKARRGKNQKQYFNTTKP